MLDLSFAKILAVGAILAILAYGLYSWGKLNQENGQLKGEIVVWQGKYDQALAAQKASEEESKRLREKREELDTAMVDWKKSYDAIDRKNFAAQTKIKALEKENAEIRDILRTHVPDDLWRVFFPPKPPTGNDSGNKDGKGAIPQNMGGGNSNTAGAGRPNMGGTVGIPVATPTDKRQAK